MLWYNLQLCVIFIHTCRIFFVSILNESVPLWYIMLPKFLATWWGSPTPKMSEHAVSWNSIYYSQSYGCLLFYEKIDIFENFENFRFWNFLKKFWILRHSKIHSVIWKLSWYDIIIMFYYIISLSDINCRLIWGRNMKIYPHVEVGTPKLPSGSKGLSKRLYSLWHKRWNLKNLLMCRFDDFLRL